MKTAPILILSMIFFMSCNDTKVTTPVPGGSHQIDTISQQTYTNWSGAWEKLGAGYTDTLLTKYFTMPNIDLQEFATEPHYAARFVLGLDTSTVQYEPHLMLVGVNESGKSIIPANGFPNGKIYDVTVPCPKYCDKNSVSPK